MRLDDPKHEKYFHGTFTLIWLILIPVSALTSLKESITWIVLMSAWANFAGHFSAWQASKGESEIMEKLDASDTR